MSNDKLFTSQDIANIKVELLERQLSYKNTLVITAFLCVLSEIFLALACIQTYRLANVFDLVYAIFVMTIMALFLAYIVFEYLKVLEDEKTEDAVVEKTMKSFSAGRMR